MDSTGARTNRELAPAEDTVSDILGGLIGGARRLLFGWTLPSALVIALYAILASPALGGIRIVGKVEAMDAATRGLILAFSALGLGITLSAISTPLYRLLEGYTWPRRLQRWGIRRQTTKKRYLQTRAESANPGWERALWLEQLQRFPIEDNQIAPTSLGNALRALETYGVDRYQLDSQTWWIELVTLTPDSLRAELGEARAHIDFFVCLVYLSCAFALSALFTGLFAQGGTTSLVLSGVIAFILVPFWYRSAVTSTSYLQVVVRALVHIGRKHVANSLGLRIPATIEEEREMWSLAAAFVFYPYNPKWSGRLDKFRVVDEEEADKLA
jgi:hypothetical protein